MNLSAAEAEIVNGLDPTFRPYALRLREAAFANGLPFTFLSGLRSRAQQQAEASKPNRTTPAAAPGKSKHEIGFAFDVDLIADNGAPIYTTAQLGYLGRLAEGFGMTWGGRFLPKPDPNHFEAPFTREQLAAYRTVQLVGAAAVLGLVVVVATD
jgi:hypothetical protein